MLPQEKVKFLRPFCAFCIKKGNELWCKVEGSSLMQMDVYYAGKSIPPCCTKIKQKHAKFRQLYRIVIVQYVHITVK